MIEVAKEVGAGMKQTQALRVMMGGDSVFLTGAPGSGKTFVLNQFIKLAKQAGKRVAVTASTGIAATHIGGSTVHSWSGLGIRDEITEGDEKWLKDSERLLKRYNNLDILIIDEVSMLHGKRLDMINQVAQWLRENEAPFGGLQVILTGDLFQLPPINRQQETIDFVHLSEAWQQLAPKICYLSEQHRQDDQALLDILRAMRANDINEAHYDALTERLGREAPLDTVVTKLYSHNQDVEQINDHYLRAITQEAHTYNMEVSGSQAKTEQLMKSVLAPQTLTLKQGAEVMFVANNFVEGFANGSRGQVVDFTDDGAPIVQLQRSGKEITVEPHSWALEEDGKERARVSQLPLRLAWAITIHKSQGMSLDSAEIDLSRAFTPGMGYVALSRVRALDGLYLKGINNTALRMHEEVFTFDEALRKQSALLAAGTDDGPYELPTDTNVDQASPDGALLSALKAWRNAEAQARSIPHYMIASNKTLEALAAQRPTSEVRLKLVHGVGPKVVERYGEVLLAQIQKHVEAGGADISSSKQETQAASNSEVSASVRSFLSERGVALSDEDLASLSKLL